MRTTQPDLQLAPTPRVTFIALALALALAVSACSGAGEGSFVNGEGGDTNVNGEGGGHEPPGEVSQDGLWSVPGEYAAHAGSGGYGGGGEGAMGGADASASYDDTSAAPGGGGDEAFPGDPSNGGGEVKAGVTDDNANYDAFLSYQDTFTQLANTRPIDISVRHHFRVVNGTEPTPNALLRLMVGGEEVFRGRTLANGEVYAHPRALGVADDAAIDYALEVGGEEIDAGVLEAGSQGSELAFTTGSGPGDLERIRVDMALMVDTTGSMGDEIAKLRNTWVGIVDAIGDLDERIDLRFALVVYRDRQDAYVVKYLDFTPDLQAMQQALTEVQADGGGDYPEDLEAALDVSVNYLEWDPQADVRLLFTLADASPSIYEDAKPYPTTLNKAVERGIRVHAIAASGSGEDAEYVFRQMAQYTAGRFLFLTYDNDIPGKPGTGTGSGGDDGYTVEDYLTGTLDELVVKLVALDVTALTEGVDALPIPETAEQ